MHRAICYTYVHYTICTNPENRSVRQVVLYPVPHSDCCRWLTVESVNVALKGNVHYYSSYLLLCQCNEMVSIFASMLLVTTPSSPILSHRHLLIVVIVLGILSLSCSFRSVALNDLTAARFRSVPPRCYRTKAKAISFLWR
jgi:hypothetical protein